MPERPAHDKSKAPQLSRLEKLRKDWASADKSRAADDYAPDMPGVDGAEYLLGYLFEIGPTVAAGMSAGPITHEELRAWMHNIGVELRPWEVRILRRLSCDYLAESHRAEKADCAAPWRPVEVVIDRAAVADRMRNAIRAMAGD